MTMTTMEEDVEEIEHVFVAHEIDLDYEFDAPRFFDFTRSESPSESHQAQLWFLNAPTYPPSPFVTKLVVREDFSLDDVENLEYTSYMDDYGDNDDEKSGVPLGVKFTEKYFENSVYVPANYLTDPAPALTVAHLDAATLLSRGLAAKGSKALGGRINGMLGGILQNDAMQPQQVPTGLTFCSKTICDGLHPKAKSAVPKSSTLMKPTASQLAKQNRPPKNVGSRFQKLLSQNERNLCISSRLETQAAKRQKLEGGLMCKANDVKQQTNFVHKAPKRAITVDQNSSKLRLTIPAEPDLKTAHRAQRIRPKDVAEHVTMAAPRFKARPLNREILDAPSMPIPKRSTPQLPEFQEFHLKTGERAMQHISATSSTLFHCNDSDKGLDKHPAVSVQEKRIRDLRRPSALSAPKYDGLSFTNNFKARPLNKKMLSGIGIFRNSKPETTEPMEFNFYTEKGVQDNPPIELFSKLSLTSEVQPNNESHLKLPQHSRMCRKDLKENRLNSFHRDQQEKPFMFGAKQIHYGNDGCISEAGTLLSTRRGLGIR